MRSLSHSTALFFLFASLCYSPAQTIRYGRDDAGNRTSKSVLMVRLADENSAGEGSFSLCVQPLELRTGGQEARTIRWSLDPTADVGSIPMNTGVQPNGMVTVQVPLVSGSSDGRNPDISLVYSSYAGRGDAGYGWSIAGVSKISLIDRNVGEYIFKEILWKAFF